MKSPSNLTKSPVNLPKSPVNLPKSPVNLTKSQVNLPKSPVNLPKSPVNHHFEPDFLPWKARLDLPSFAPPDPRAVTLLAHAAAGPKGETGEEAETWGKNGDFTSQKMGICWFGVPKKIRNLHYRWFPSHGGFSIGKITNHRLNKPRKMWRRWWFWDFLCERIGDLSEDWSKSWAGWFPWEFPWGFHVNYKQLNMIFECGKKWTTLVFTCRSTMEVWGTIFYFKTNISYFCWWYNYELVGWHLAAG